LKGKTMTKPVFCGKIQIGGGAPVSVQSMITTKTTDVEGAVAEINALVLAGCDMVRLAVPNMDAAKAFGKIHRQVTVPLVADIHFDHTLAIESIRQGADKIRINPGNIGNADQVQAVVNAAKEYNIPIRVGVNAGSLEKDILEHKGICADALVESAMRNVNLLESMDFREIVISMKASNVKMTYDAYKTISTLTDYPLHIGITEAGPANIAILKSAVGLGGLLLAGIGDTMRVSITGDSLKEPEVAREILAAAGLRQNAIEFISCPTCGRTKVDLAKMSETIESRLRNEIAPLRRQRGLSPISVAVMGCEVNGPGEAAGADVGVACGSGRGVLFVKGKIIKTVKEDEIIDEILRLVEDYEAYSG
jgi:(E)-4-hydroxy-3-methylbut-2-enyl-diphosphate synthase